MRAKPSPWLDLSLVLATGAAHLFFENVLNAKAPFIVGALLFWTAWFFWRIRVPGQAAQWGFRRDTLAPSAIANGIFFGACAVALISFGIAQGRGFPPPGFFVLLALYPIWGLVQQFLLCAVVARGLEEITRRRGLAVSVSALLFGLVHAPDWALCGLTAVAGAFWTTCFLRWPNLWVHGVTHGWLGGVAYWFVLGRDAWSELVKGIREMGIG